MHVDNKKVIHNNTKITYLVQDTFLIVCHMMYQHCTLHFTYQFLRFTCPLVNPPLVWPPLYDEGAQPAPPRPTPTCLLLFPFLL